MKYSEIMQNVPAHWHPMDYENSKWEAVPVSGTEFQEARNMFDGHYYLGRTGLYKVQNPLLYAKFCLKKSEYETRGPVEIQTLFHDTSNENISSICESNFDWRFGTRFMFGPGVYFSVKPDIAFKHSSKSQSIYRAMFAVDVLVQKIQEGDEKIFLPDPGFDTVVAHGGVTVVKYFDNWLPERRQKITEIITNPVPKTILSYCEDFTPNFFESLCILSGYP